METICIKMDDELLNRMNHNMKSFGYSTKTEFIREAIRNKIEEDEKKILIKEFLKTHGKSKKKTTYKQNKKIREEVFAEIAKEQRWD